MIKIPSTAEQRYIFEISVGMPYQLRILTHYLFISSERNTGMVDGVTYFDLQQLLYIKPAPGRKESGMPTKQTIRNYIKAIARECPEHFRVITEGQSLRFCFPKLPEIYVNTFFDMGSDAGVNIDPDTPETLANTGVDAIISKEENTEVNTLPDTPASVKKNNIYKNNLTNSNTKKAIDPHFRPSREVVDIAKERGYLRAEEPDEIAAFIRYNQMHQTEWADFNAVYLRWLENSTRYSQQQDTRRKIRMENSRSSNHGSCSKKPFGSIIELVAFHNQGAEHPGEGGFNSEAHTLEDAHPKSYEMALAEIDECVWATFHESARPFGQRYLV